MRLALAVMLLLAAYAASSPAPRSELRALRVEFNGVLVPLVAASEAAEPASTEWVLARLDEIDHLRDAIEVLPGSDRAVRYFRAALNRLDAAARRLADAGLPSRFGAQELLHRAEEQWDEGEELYRR